MLFYVNKFPKKKIFTSIFIASRIRSGVPALTLSPTLAKSLIKVPGIGDLTLFFSASDSPTPPLLFFCSANVF